MQLDQHYVDPRLVELYDIDNPRGADTDFYIGLAAELGARAIIDLGCGTGAAGAAWALAAGGASVSGFDRSVWAIAEANWSYRQLAVRGRAMRQDLARVQFQPRRGLGTH